VKEILIKDSNIHSFKWNRDMQTLEIVFSTDIFVKYTYENIDFSLASEMILADSPGAFFAKAIRPHVKSYPFSKSYVPHDETLEPPKDLEDKLKKSLKPSKLRVTETDKIIKKKEKP
jgi:hypothetical protein